jgi:hypothetical protein
MVSQDSEEPCRLFGGSNDRGRAGRYHLSEQLAPPRRTVLLLPIDLLAAPTRARPTKAFA